MTTHRLNKIDEEIMAPFAMIDPELPEGFTSNLTYYEWLCRRKPYPMGRDRWYVIGLWTIVILGIPSMSLGSRVETSFIGILLNSGGILSFLSVVGAPVVTLGAFFGWMPHAFRRDLKDGVIQSLFQASVSSEEILSGLRAWAVRINLMHVVPVALIFFAAKLFIKELDYPQPMNLYLIGSSLMFLVVAVMVWFLLLETGLALSFIFPRTGGGIFVVQAIIILLVAFIGGYYLADGTQYYIVPHFRSLFFNTDLVQIWFCLIYSVLIGLGVPLLHFQAIKLLNDWKSVLLQKEPN
jgi:hypothetical protein